MSEPEPVSSKLQAARLLFRSAHALEEAVDFLQIPFEQELIEVLVRAGWGPGIAGSIDTWRLKLIVAAKALICDAIVEGLEGGEGHWVSEAVKMRIEGERRNPVTFPLTDPPTED